MIYGYASKTVSDGGLQQMREVCIAADAETVRRLAKHLLESADTLKKVTNANWHQHAPVDLANSLGCDVIVARPLENLDSSGGDSAE